MPINYATLSPAQRELCHDDFSMKFALIKQTFLELPIPLFDRSRPLEYHDTMYKTCLRYLEAMDQYKKQQMIAIIASMISGQCERVVQLVEELRDSF